MPAKITATVTEGNNAKLDPNDWRAKAKAWNVTLHLKRRKLTTPFWTGGLCRKPTAEDVLTCLVSDAHSVAWSTLEQWCDEFGYDTDSRKAERTYKECLRIAKRLRRFLGSDYLFETMGGELLAEATSE